MNVAKKKTRKFRVRITVEVLVRAWLEVLYFDPSVKRVRIDIKKNSNQELEITATGRGRLRARTNKDVADIWITGSPKVISQWEKFFTDFASVPVFSLRQYMKWAKGVI